MEQNVILLRCQLKQQIISRKRILPHRIHLNCEIIIKMVIIFMLRPARNITGFRFCKQACSRIGETVTDKTIHKFGNRGRWTNVGPMKFHNYGIITN